MRREWQLLRAFQAFIASNPKVVFGEDPMRAIGGRGG